MQTDAELYEFIVQLKMRRLTFSDTSYVSAIAPGG